ncbi:hypothetical protein PUR_25140 [Paenibacillus sp. URB8-2]|nr:hypothetical protein PUR_25140 [Paenibacillus sp. URB8-2]
MELIGGLGRTIRTVFNADPLRLPANDFDYHFALEQLENKAHNMFVSLETTLQALKGDVENGVATSLTLVDIYPAKNKLS